MLRSLWLHKLLRLPYSRRERRLSAARQRRGIQLKLEALEDRLTPSTVTESAADAATLQTDLNNATAANTQYIINLTGASSAYNLAAGKELIVSAAASGSSVTIAGTGQSITGNGNRVFNINSGANVTIQNVTITGGSVTGSSAQGGGVYLSGSGTVRINDSIIRGNRVQGTNATAAGQSGGNAQGGGLYVNGSGWNVTLSGDTFSDNTAISGNGNGAPGGLAAGGAAYISGSGGSLTILNDANNPSLMLNNSAQAGTGGSNSAEGGAVFLSAAGATVHIGNTTFYGNSAINNSKLSGQAVGGAIDFRNSNFTMVNSTVANNTATAPGTVYGGGIADNDPSPPLGSTDQTIVFDNNTITANTIHGGTNLGAGISLDPNANNPTLRNNLIAGNIGVGSSAADIEDVIIGGQPLINATNNFIGSVNPAADFSTTNNIIGNTQVQLGGVVGVTASGSAVGGPIYYPLLSGALSIGAGTTAALGDIATVEGTTTANAVDEIGNPRSSNGSIDIGAVQFQTLPVITGNPNSQTVTAGANVTFTASAKGIPAPKVQWQVSTDGGKTFNNINGATTTTLTLKNVDTSLSGNEYQAVFTNSAGTATTSAATLTVNAASSTIFLALAPVHPIHASSQDQTVAVGAAVFDCNGKIDEGTVTFVLYNSNNVQVGKAVQANVSDGAAVTFLTVPGGTPAGHYTIVASYTDPSGAFVAASPVTTKLNINPPGPRGSHSHHSPKPHHQSGSPHSPGSGDLEATILQWIANLEQTILSGLSAMQGTINHDNKK